MFSPTTRRLVSMAKFFNAPLEPYTIKSILWGAALSTILFLTSYSVRETKKAGPLEFTEEERNLKTRLRDPRRPPWPLLHQRVVLLRDGKGAPEDIPVLWEQTKYYYPSDWLIPIELTQVLKYSSATFLRNYVADPDKMRKEVLTQLMNIKYGQTENISQFRVNRDVKEIISMAIDDLENMDLTSSAHELLVPTHT